MTKLQFNSIVPNDIYYNNQSVNKVFYVDPNGVQTEVWPLTPTVSVGTDLVRFRITLGGMDSESGELSSVQSVIFNSNGNLRITAAADRAGGGGSNVTTSRKGYKLNESGEEVQMSNSELNSMRWIQGVPEDFDAADAGYQIKAYRDPNFTRESGWSALNDRAPVNAGNLTEGADFIVWPESYANLTQETNSSGILNNNERFIFVIKDPTGNETSFGILIEVIHEP